MQTIVFVHGMFQNPKSWNKWIKYFSAKGYECVAPAWPLHDGEPAELRSNPPRSLGELSLDQVVNTIQKVVSEYESPIVIGHSVGGLVTQILLNRQIISGGIAISSVAPNRMLDFDWSFFKNSATITNPLKGDEPIFMDAKTFYAAFANTLSEEDANEAFEVFATHDSRNVLRDCMGESGKIDLEEPHAPLLLLAAEKDEIIPAHLVEKNSKAYKDEDSVIGFKEFKDRSHYICGERGWEEVAEYILGWIDQQVTLGKIKLSPKMSDAA